jgi:hypothetical protein
MTKREEAQAAQIDKLVTGYAKQINKLRSDGNAELQHHEELHKERQEARLQRNMDKQDGLWRIVPEWMQEAVETRAAELLGATPLDLSQKTEASNAD